MGDCIVWLIDDDPIQNRLNSKTIKKSLTRDCEIKTYIDSREALRILETMEEIPDLVFIDLNMPHIDGLTFIRQVALTDIDIPFFILSSAVDQEILDFSEEYEFVKKCIKKPLIKSDVAFLRSMPF
jgi:CheY-like chemotaxis protein